MASDPFSPGEPTNLLMAAVTGLVAAVVYMFHRITKLWSERIEDQKDRVADHKEHTADLMEAHRIMDSTNKALRSAYGAKKLPPDDC